VSHGTDAKIIHCEIRLIYEINQSSPFGFGAVAWGHMKTLKSIDGKSLLIGLLLASTFFFATGAADDSDLAKQLRLLGFTEEEIKEELKNKGGKQPADILKEPMPKQASPKVPAQRPRNYRVVQVPKTTATIEYEYAWLEEFMYAVTTGREIAKTPGSIGGWPKIQRAPNFNWAAQEGWEVDPSGISHQITSGAKKYYTLMRRPKK